MTGCVLAMFGENFYGLKSFTIRCFSRVFFSIEVSTFCGLTSEVGSFQLHLAQSRMKKQSQEKKICSKSKVDASKQWVEDNWIDIGKKGSEMRLPDGTGNWAGVLSLFPCLLDFLTPSAARTKITRLTLKYEEGHLCYKMNTLHAPQYGWENDKLLFQWASERLKSGKYLSSNLARLALAHIDPNNHFEANQAWDQMYSRFLVRNQLSPNPDDLPVLELSKAKCLLGCGALEVSQKDGEKDQGVKDLGTTGGLDDCEDDCGGSRTLMENLVVSTPDQHAQLKQFEVCRQSVSIYKRIILHLISGRDLGTIWLFCQQPRVTGSSQSVCSFECSFSSFPAYFCC
jgi:hypothetical protein